MNNKKYEELLEKHPNLDYNEYNRSGTAKLQDGKETLIFKEREIGTHDKILTFAEVRSGYFGRPKMMIYAAEDNGVTSTYVSNGKKSEKTELEMFLEKRGKARAGRLIADLGVAISGGIAPFISTSPNATLAAYGLATAAAFDVFIFGWYRTVEDHNLVHAVDKIEEIVKDYRGD